MVFSRWNQLYNNYYLRWWRLCLNNKYRNMFLEIVLFLVVVFLVIVGIDCCSDNC